MQQPTDVTHRCGSFHVLFKARKCEPDIARLSQMSIYIGTRTDGAEQWVVTLDASKIDTKSKTIRRGVFYKIKQMFEQGLSLGSAMKRFETSKYAGSVASIRSINNGTIWSKQSQAAAQDSIYTGSEACFSYNIFSHYLTYIVDQLTHQAMLMLISQWLLSGVTWMEPVLHYPMSTIGALPTVAWLERIVSVIAMYVKYLE